jgi:hypothetical protein
MARVIVLLYHIQARKKHRNYTILMLYDKMAPGVNFSSRKSWGSVDISCSS